MSDLSTVGWLTQSCDIVSNKIRYKHVSVGAHPVIIGDVWVVILANPVHSVSFYDPVQQAYLPFLKVPSYAFINSSSQEDN